ncbi:hypothetical protein [Streptomyces sp. NPDC059003]|uniref:hypothetical protein n=1 Tax=Streptomyces sp. NPDC059003 TaxID=3346691 RepID=UPI0036C02350
MPVARYALQYAAQLADLLGPGWSAASCDCLTDAVLCGPGIELDVSTTAPVRSCTPVLVKTRARGDLSWPRRGDYRGTASGTIGDPAAVAAVIRSTIVPQWARLVEELTVRTHREQEAIQQFVHQAAAVLGDSCRTVYGSRPGVASLRWDGGNATLWADSEGRISAPAIEVPWIKGSDQVLALLRAAISSAT